MWFERKQQERSARYVTFSMSLNLPFVEHLGKFPSIFTSSQPLAPSGTIRTLPELSIPA